MAVMPKEVQDIFNCARVVVFSTADADGQPNSCVVGMKKIIDDENVYLSDQFFKKTLANIQQNTKVAIALWSDDGAYQMHGTARYVNEGEDFLSQKGWVEEAFRSFGRSISPKGGCYVHIDSVYQMSSGPTAGDQIA